MVPFCHAITGNPRHKEIEGLPATNFRGSVTVSRNIFQIEDMCFLLIRYVRTVKT